MQTVLLVAYLLIAIAMIAVILLQRSEGGALGIGGGGGGFMTARGSANLLTRTTAILATLFFATAIGLTVLSELDRGSSGILDAADDAGEGAQVTDLLDAFNQLPGSDTDPGLAVPTTDTTTDATTPVDGAGTVETDPGLAVPTDTTTETPEQPATN